MRHAAACRGDVGGADGGDQLVTELLRLVCGDDLCLVHNGSLSNHNTLRRALRREGIEFQTENDSEVAAAYMTWKLRNGATLKEALEDGLHDLDGFFTFLVGTADGFAVVRDPIACKHAVKIMREQKSGAIINIASAAAIEMSSVRDSSASAFTAMVSPEPISNVSI